MQGETKKLFVGENVQAEADPRTGKPLGRPIYFSKLRNGHYLTLEQADALATELEMAIVAVKRAAVGVRG